MAGWSGAIIHFEPEEAQMIRTIVIGAGVMGASVAYRLAQAGAAVTVLEAARIGGGTSGISFAWTNAHKKTAKTLSRSECRRHEGAFGTG
jgi:glycine/D-amino acid oxidase-like deaminating enzyme